MKFKISDILENPENPRTIKNDKFEALVNSILVFPKMMSIRPIVVDDVHISMGGNMRSNAVKEIAKMGEEKVHDRIIEILEQRNETDEVENDKIAFQNMQILRPIFEGYYPEGWVKVFKNLNESERREFILKDNSSFGDWDYDELANKFKDWELDEADIWKKIDVETLSDEFELPSGSKEPIQKITFTLSDNQVVFVNECLAEIQKTDDFKDMDDLENDNKNGNALYLICQEWKGK